MRLYVPSVEPRSLCALLVCVPPVHRVSEQLPVCHLQGCLPFIGPPVCPLSPAGSSVKHKTVLGRPHPGPATLGGLVSEWVGGWATAPRKGGGGGFAMATTMCRVLGAVWMVRCGVHCCWCGEMCRVQSAHYSVDKLRRVSIVQFAECTAECAECMRLKSTPCA